MNPQKELYYIKAANQRYVKTLNELARIPHNHPKDTKPATYNNFYDSRFYNNTKKY